MNHYINMLTVILQIIEVIPNLQIFIFFYYFLSYLNFFILIKAIFELIIRTLIKIIHFMDDLILI